MSKIRKSGKISFGPSQRLEKIAQIYITCRTSVRAEVTFWWDIPSHEKTSPPPKNPGENPQIFENPQSSDFEKFPNPRDEKSPIPEIKIPSY